MTDEQLAILTEAHAELLEKLVLAGVFSFTNGSITLHFDHAGTLRKVETLKHVAFTA